LSLKVVRSMERTGTTKYYMRLKEIICEVKAKRTVIYDDRFPDGSIIKAVHNQDPETNETLSFEMAYIDVNRQGDSSNRVFGYDTAHQKKDSDKVEAHCHYKGKDYNMREFSSFKDLLDRFTNGVNMIRQDKDPSILEYRKNKTLKDFNGDTVLFDFYTKMMPIMKKADQERLATKDLNVNLVTSSNKKA